MQSWEWRRGMHTASAREHGTARCDTVCSPSSNIPMRRRTTTPVSGNCGRQPPIARSRAGSAQAGAPICSLPFDQLSVPQHDADLMRIRQFVLSWTANLSFYRVEQLPDKPIIAAFDAEGFSASGGLLTLREIERRLGLAPRLAAHIVDPRELTQVVHPTEEIIRFRMLMIAAGYEDGNDADVLRHDPMFKLAMGRLPAGSPLCSQSTISRLENRPDKRALLRMGYGLIDLYCDSVRQVPRRIVLDIDDHFDAAHGAQELRVFNAHYDAHGFSPIVVFDGE